MYCGFECVPNARWRLLKALHLTMMISKHLFYSSKGRKRWKVYPPPNRAETLPRFSSRDYTEKDMEGTHPVIDTVLGPGDVLYMPRGWIHQAHTPQESSGKDESGHSLHLTASAMQKWSWIDLLDLVMPEALESVAASETSTSLREGLPRNFLSYMGAMYDTMSEEAPEGLKQAISKADETKKMEIVMRSFASVQ